jgi:SOS-response transcriptional repressor LexA
LKHPEGGYREFKIGDLFVGQTGDIDLQQQDGNGKGCFFINSGVQNCGIKGRTDRLAKIFPSNTITVDFFGNAYYRPFEYKMATHNHVFSLSGDVIKNEQIGLYLVAQMSYLTKLYSFNEMGTWSKIKEQKLLLPIKGNGEIDYVFMESRIRELKESRIRELKAYLKAAGFEDCNLTQSEIDALRIINLGQKPMSKFGIVNEFSVSNSHNILKSDVVFGSGSTPYVTASEGNNSIVSYISYNPDMIEKGNTIMIGGKTLVVTYQPNDFFSNDSHNLVLTINHETGRTESAQLFMVAALYKSLSPKYSWGDSISKAKIQSDEVFFPIKNDGTIDFEFMELYVNAIKKQCIATLKQEISREHKAYEKAVVVNSVEIETDKDKTKVIILPEYREGCIPLYTLSAACGAFEDEEKPETGEWIDVTGHGFTPDKDRYFVVQAKGESMLPKIKDGDLCVFEWSQYHAGSRNGEIVLARTYEFDPEFDGRYTIKKYSSEKVETEDSWHHVKIELHPLNHDPKYSTIELNEDMEKHIIGILKCVL